MTQSDPKIELDALYRLVLSHPEGIGAARLENELGTPISRRTLVR